MTIRVLHIGKYYAPFSGGIENCIGDLLPALADKGISVAALVHNHDPHVLKTVVEIRENIRIYRAPCHGSLLYAPLKKISGGQRPKKDEPG